VTSKEFGNEFELLTDHPPFPWQWELFQRFARGEFPKSCNLPTGLGKTSIVAIWLIARIHHPEKVPTRLVYVVNRRTVVDQTTTEVEKLRTNLPKLNSKLSELAISTLRGQFADNREWSADPSRPAVICGTVDMIGSRLLFHGYGVGRNHRPLHAGFLGQDVLLVHDEAHLEPAFQELLVSIRDEQARCNEFRKFHVVELSATSRGNSDTFELSDADKKNEIVAKRIHAKKAIEFLAIDDEKKQLADKIVELALAHKDSQRPILVFVRGVENVGKVVAALRKAKQEVQQLTGTLRGLERDELVNDPIFQRFLPGAIAGGKTVYLVCTSAGEVGVNISADHLVCDLSPFESMAQRFGRVNRFGECNVTRIDVVHPKTFKADDKVDPRREKTLALLRMLNGNGNPAALGGLDLDERLAAFSPQPEILRVSDILFDAWALTTIREKLPGRPPVADYLHGVTDWEPPQTKVAWRTEVWEVRLNDPGERKQFQQYAAELLDDYPLKTHELLGDRTDRVFNNLKKLAAPAETPVWIVDEEDAVVVSTLGQLLDGNKDFLGDKTLLLPPQAGGLEKGLLDGTAKYDQESKDYDVADEWKDEHGALRKRQWDDPIKPDRMKREREISFNDSEDADAEPTRTWYWFVRPSGAEADAKSARESYDLQQHLDDARAFAKSIVTDLRFPEMLAHAVVLGAQFHDLGKDRQGWQNGIGNADYPSKKWAKSGRRGPMKVRSTYRHEFGSYLDVRLQPEFVKLPPDYQELVLHLISAHHGRGRPHFPDDEAFDGNHPGEKTRSLATEVPRRFAHLQRKFGRWGLAYLESLVRAADVLASRKAEGGDR
jgi:CRISPR-associated endonuclease/helicase Cas3